MADRFRELKTRLPWVDEILKEEGMLDHVVYTHDPTDDHSSLTLHLSKKLGEIEFLTIEQQDTREDHGERVRNWARRAKIIKRHQE